MIIQKPTNYICSSRKYELLTYLFSFLIALMYFKVLIFQEGGKPIRRAIALRAKVYCLEFEDLVQLLKNKGVPKHFVHHYLRFMNYQSTLFGRKIFYSNYHKFSNRTFKIIAHKQRKLALRYQKILLVHLNTKYIIFYPLT